MDRTKAHCVCQHKPFYAIKGNFITCRNKLCPIKWFHLSCLGIDFKPKTYECLICNESDYTRITMTISRHAIDRLAHQGHFKACCLLCKHIVDEETSSDVDKACAYFFLAHYDFGGMLEQGDHAVMALLTNGCLMEGFPEDELYVNMVVKSGFILRHLREGEMEAKGGNLVEKGTLNGYLLSRVTQWAASQAREMQVNHELQNTASPRQNRRPQGYIRLGPSNPIDSYLFPSNKGEAVKEPEPAVEVEPKAGPELELETLMKLLGLGNSRKRNAEGKPLEK